ncbi:MAG: SMP-30/gluconolactonase/LRE family protein [Candidatus Limnocylindrales bacterium]
MTTPNDRAPSAIELLVDFKSFLGEGPVWDARIGRVAWVDILTGRLHLTARDGTTRTIQLPSPVGCLVPRASGGWVAALADGFWTVADDGATERLVDVQSDRPDLRFNDGKCDPQGRFWAGTMALDHRAGAGALYRLDPDLSVHRMVDGVAISNGLDWSLDGRTMYYVDTPTRRIDRFDFDPTSGTIADRRPFAAIDPGDGSPDGLTVDAEGGIWLALWDGWRVRRYLPDGSIEREIRLPVSEVTCPVFGGPDLDELYITTAWELLSEEQHAAEPLAGGLFRARPGVLGRPPTAFTG